MGKMIGPRKIRSYSKEFKATAVRLSHLPGVQVQEVAEALVIHPILLTRWRKGYREGLIEHDGPRRTMKGQLSIFHFLFNMSETCQLDSWTPPARIDWAGGSTAGPLATKKYFPRAL